MKRSRSSRVAVVLACAAILSVPLDGHAEITGVTRVGFLPRGGEAVFATHAPGRPDELFVLDKQGYVEVLNLQTGTFNSQPFLDVRSLVDDGANEQGLLGLAFDPDYATNGHFYINYTRDPGPGRDRTRIDRYTAGNPSGATIVSVGTRQSVLEFEQDFNNHNGGWIGFSPNDGYLYIASGDGGSGNDPNNRGQSLNTRLGKILRIDVDGDDFPRSSIENYSVPADNPFVDDGTPGTRDEIWAYGLRNPWRSSFDRETGDLWIGDVGQGAREEIDRIPDGDGGRNLGWRLREGDIQTPGVGGPIPPKYLGPEYDYLSNGSGLFGGNSVVGGYVYRGPDPEVQGRYFFADSFPSQLWTFDPSDPDGTVQNVESILGNGTISTPVSFGEDTNGNLYIVDLGGAIYRIDTDAFNAGDFSGDGSVDNNDLNLLLANWSVAASPAPAGWIGAVPTDPIVDNDELNALLSSWGAGQGSSIALASGADQTAVGAGDSPVPEPTALSLLGVSLIACAARRRSPLRK